MARWCVSVAVVLFTLVVPGWADAPRVWLTSRSMAAWAMPIAPGIAYRREQMITAHEPLRLHDLAVALRDPRIALGVGVA